MLWLAGRRRWQCPDPITALMVFATLASFEALLPLAGAFQHLSTSLTSARRLQRDHCRGQAPGGAHSKTPLPGVPCR